MSDDEKLGPYLKRYLVDWKICPATSWRKAYIVCLHDCTAAGLMPFHPFAVSISTPDGERVSWIEHDNYWEARRYYKERIRLLLAQSDHATAKTALVRPPPEPRPESKVIYECE